METAKVSKKTGSTANPDELEADLLFGMKAICAFLRMSESTVLRWQREYDDFPVKKNGGHVSSRRKLNIWFQEYLER